MKNAVPDWIRAQMFHDVYRKNPDVMPIRAEIIYDDKTSSPISYRFVGNTFMALLKRRKEPSLPTQPPPRSEGPGKIVETVDPMEGSRTMAAGVSQLIGAAVDMTGSTVRFRITPLLSGVTVSWERMSLPSRQWLRDLEQEIIAFGVCNGLQIWFREH